MKNPAGVLAGVGALLMTSAVVVDNLTLASGDYRAVFSAAVVLMVLALGCLAAAFHRGGSVVRAVCAVFSLPTFVIVNDVLRRGTYVFS